MYSVFNCILVYCTVYNNNYNNNWLYLSIYPTVIDVGYTPSQQVAVRGFTFCPKPLYVRRKKIINVQFPGHFRWRLKSANSIILWSLYDDVNVLSSHHKPLHPYLWTLTGLRTCQFNGSSSETDSFSSLKTWRNFSAKCYKWSWGARTVRKGKTVDVRVQLPIFSTL